MRLDVQSPALGITCMCASFGALVSGEDLFVELAVCTLCYFGF